MTLLDNDFPLIAALPTEITDSTELPFDRGEWIVQPKYDGHRVIIDYRGDEPRILNRKGATYGARRFDVAIPDSWQGVVVDGEYMPPKRGRRPAYMIFDCLIDGRDNTMYGRSWRQRMDAVSDLVDRSDGNDPMSGVHDPMSGVHMVNWVLVRESRGGWKWNRNPTSPKHFATIEEASIYGHYKFHRLDQIDGAVYKAIDDPYMPGRDSGWFKVKFTNDIDAVVTDLNIDSKSNCELSIHDPLTDTMFPIGRAATAGKGKITVGTVVTVRFLEFTDGLRLREPRIVMIRDDKSQTECTVSQLVPFCRQLQTDEST